MQYFKDNRTEEHKKTHTRFINAIDRYMSGWGKAEKGLSRVIWACRPEHADAVFKWVLSREDMSNVQYHNKFYKPSNFAHLQVYVVDDMHPAIID